MSDDRYPFTTLEMDLLGIVGNDYESLETIRRYHWNEDIPMPAVDAMIRSLRDLQGEGWIQCYRYVLDLQDFMPIDDFLDEEAESPIQLTGGATLWWLITEKGLVVLRTHFAAFEDDPGKS